MIPESTIETAVLATVIVTTFTMALFHRSPMGEKSIAMSIADWWRSRKTNKSEVD